MCVVCGVCVWWCGVVCVWCVCVCVVCCVLYFIHILEPTRQAETSYAVVCVKKKINLHLREQKQQE